MRYLLLILLLFLSSCHPCSNIRQPHVAGTFYPSDPKELSALLDAQLASVPLLENPPGKIVGLILPHAGYRYSGPTAAFGYKLIEGMSFDTVIILGPFHKANFPGAAIWRSGCWKTPLGMIPVDDQLAQAIISENVDFNYSPEIHLKEHSIEMELPFLQVVLKKFKIVPILISTPSLEEAQLLAQAIWKNIQGKNVLIIASTDMSHYYPENIGKKIDNLTLELLRKESSDELIKQQALKNVELCGSEATVTLLEITKLMGNTHLEVLNYSTSGDRPGGDKNRVVGYGSSVIYQTLITPEEEKALLTIAKSTLTSFVNSGKIPEFNVSNSVLDEKKAVFVTLRKNGVLRGCIGRITPTEPLYLAVRNMTVEAASKDSRFEPVSPDELNDIQIEISILGPLQKVNSADDIELGKNGVVVKQGDRRGVFLPSVAREMGWTKEEFLRHLCVDKSGLPADCWKDKQTEIFVFATQEIK